MFGIHIVLLMMDIFVYKWDIMHMIMDFIFLWFNFFNYMTLNKIFIGIHLALLAFIILVSLMNIQYIIEKAADNQDWTPLIVYCVHFFLVYFAMLALTGKRFKDHMQQ